MVQNASIFSKEFIFEKNFGARCALEISDDFVKMSKKKQILANFHIFNGAQRAPNIFLEMKSLEKIDAFCTKNECKILKIDNN